MPARFTRLFSLTMSILNTDDAQALFRPFGGGLPRKGKGAPRKKKPQPVVEPVAPTEPVSNTLDLETSPPPPPPPRLVRPVFAVPAADDAVWEEVLTEVAPARPPSVPVRITFAESKELPHWHEVPLATPGLAEVPKPKDTRPHHFIAKEEAELLPDWFQDMERPHLESVARAAVKGLQQYVLLALPAERMKAFTRRVGMVARKVVDAQGRLTGYEYPKAGHEQLLAVLPWTHHLPDDDANDTVRRIGFLGSRLRRLER